MSSSEEYLDSLLDSILSGDQPADGSGDKKAQEAAGETKINSEAGKAMSTAEIEEMLVSMGTLGGEERSSSDDMTDELSLDDLNLDDLSAEEQPEADGDMAEEVIESEDMSLDDLSLDDLNLDDLSAEEQPEADGDMAEEVIESEAMGSEDMSLDDLSLDDLNLDDLSAEEQPEADDDMAEEEIESEAMGSEDMSLDDLSLDDLNLDDLSAEEQPEADGDMAGEAIESEAMGSEDMSLDDLSLDDLSLDDLNLDDLSAEEAGEGEPESGLEIEELDLGNDDDMGGLALEEHLMDEMEAPEDEMSSDDGDGLMSEDEIDRLLSGEDGETAGDFAPEESEEAAEGDDDLSALLAGMDHDEDLSEINDLLEKSDQGVSADDDMLAMLEGADSESGDSFDLFENDEAAREAGGIRELSPEEIAAREGGEEKPKKEKKKRKKLFGKKKKGDEEEAEEGAETKLEDLLTTDGEEAETPAEEKKPGLVARILNFLLESDEEDEDPVAAEILADNAGETGNVTEENKELLEELSEEDKKGKKKKKKDKKKGKKGKEGEGEEGSEEGGEGEEDKKAKKKKKKEKKEKAAEEVDLLAPPEKKLSKKKVITVFLFCGTIAACIILVSTFLPNYMQKQQAHAAYDHQNYDEVFTLLYDKKRGEQDEILFQRSNLILQMERKLDSYNNYVNLNMRLEALNALISGVARYQALLPEAEKYNVVGEVSDSYAQILEKLSADFGVSEEQALEIIVLEDDKAYSFRLEEIINGAVYGEEPTGRQDILPEEEEIIERVDGLEE